MSECPAGTKCVQEYFCDENAIMVSYRVNLTPAQKQQRGQLPVRLSELSSKLFRFKNFPTFQQCINGNDGKLDVCCSTAPVQGGANIPIRQQQQQQVPNNAPAPDNQVDLVPPVSVPTK